MKFDLRQHRAHDASLASILHYAGVHFDAQARTEAKSVPDFLLPGGKEYHDAAFPASIKFGHDESGNPDSFVKLARLGERVAAGGCIYHQ